MPALGSHGPQPQVPKTVGRSPLTLAPLRDLGPDALVTHRIPAIANITLTDVEITWDNILHLTFHIHASDIFGCDPDDAPADPIPRNGTITSAIFQFQFAGSPEPFTVEISLPDVITLSPGCNAELVQHWLAQSHFISSADAAVAST